MGNGFEPCPTIVTLPTLPSSTAFPAGFVWGAAASAYQVEGSPLADGAGPSNWHRFTHTSGKVTDGSTGDIACDHYRLWKDDVVLMRRLGLGAYRFSVSWSRIFPEGTGTPNQKGLDFYKRLAEALREAGIRPFLTLYHWDHGRDGSASSSTSSRSSPRPTVPRTSPRQPGPTPT
jgi:beta-glucosidase